MAKETKTEVRKVRKGVPLRLAYKKQHIEGRNDYKRSGWAVNYIELPDGRVISPYINREMIDELEGIKVSFEEPKFSQMTVQKIVITDQAPLPLILHGYYEDTYDPLDRHLEIMSYTEDFKVIIEHE